MPSAESSSAPAPGPAAATRVEWAQASDPGRDPDKQINEDSAGYAETPFGHLFVVCDGMGGHTGGRQASDTAIRTIFEVMTGASPDRPRRQVLAQAIEEAGRRVHALGGRSSGFQRPGSTCVAVLLAGDKAETAHVGDSRAYALRGKHIYRLTRDHSMVQQMVDAGSLTEQEAAVHPEANKITRALGMTEHVQVELREEPLEVYAEDVFLLATDGLTDLVSSGEILQLTRCSLDVDGPQRACDDLVALANERGGHDNITVQVVRVLSAGPRRSRTLAQEPSDLAPEGRSSDEAASAPELPDDTVPDEGAPTVVDSDREGLAPTRVIEPSGGLATTQPGAPARTIPAEPHEIEASKGKGREPLAATAPDPPQPTVVDPSLAAAEADDGAAGAGVAGPAPGAPKSAGAVGVAGPGVVPAGPAPAPTAPDVGGSSGSTPLVYLVTAMAVAIGLLLIVVLWLAL